MLQFFQTLTPTFVKLPSLGVDISDTSIKYMRLGEPARTGRPIEDWGDLTIPSGVLHQGDIEDLAQLTTVLQELKANTRTRFVRVSLPEEHAYVFSTTIKPGITASELRSLLEFKLTENVPIPAHEVYFDYDVSPTPNASGGRSVAVTAYAKKLIEGYYSACIGADLLPLSFEIEAAAMARSVIPADVAGATMMVDFGKTRTGIGIVYQGVLLYTSTIDIGGQDLSTAMREVLGADTAESELTRLKNSIGLMGEASDKALSKTLRVQIDNIINELKTRLTYWHQRTDAHDDRRVSQIIVCGGSANLAGLSGYLTAELKVQSWVSNVWEHVLSLDHTIPPIDRAHSLGYASAVGLALHGGVTNMRV